MLISGRGTFPQSYEYSSKSFNKIDSEKDKTNLYYYSVRQIICSLTQKNKIG